MKALPCAKINLGLYVTARRPDGYHDLETVFYPIPLCDELEVTALPSPAPGTTPGDVLGVEGMAVEGRADDNLVLRALRLLRDEGYEVPPMRVRLVKHIPTGAGLGGGSSDAAAMMRLTNDLCQLHLSEDDMERLLTRLGADCPFFVRKRPVLATGIGNVFQPIEADLCGTWLVLVKPAESVSTREAYAHVTPQKPRHPLAQSITKPIEQWRELIQNDFEKSVLPLHPVIRDIKQKLYELGATYAAMSGSGSSVFGIFTQQPNEAALHAFAPHFVFSAPL